MLARCASSAANRHERLGDAQVVDREAAADQRPQLHLRVQVRDVEHDRALGVEDLQPVDGDRARRVGDDVDQRAQAARSRRRCAACPRLAGSAASMRRPSRGPCSTTDAASTAAASVPTSPGRRCRPHGRGVNRGSRARHGSLSICHSGSCAVVNIGVVTRDPMTTCRRLADATAPPDRGQRQAPSLYIVDALNFLFRAFHALPPLTTTKGDADGRDLRPLPDDPADRARAAADAPLRGLRRARRELPQRRSTPSTRPTGRRCRPSWPTQLALVRAGGRGVRPPAQLEVPGFEADDIIATLSRACAVAGGHGGGDLLVGQGPDAAVLTSNVPCSTP